MKDIKQRIRKEILELSRSFIDLGDSEKLCKKLKQTLEWQNAKHILLYAPIRGEVDVSSLFDAKEKYFYFPRVKSNELEICRVLSFSDLEKGSFGILEPKQNCEIISPNLLDFILVPGVAFDKKGGRLGKGKGFYDRLLAQFSQKSKKPFLISLAFPFQMVSEIPKEEHDVLINQIISL